MKTPGAPIRFLIAVISGWVGLRAAVLVRERGADAVPLLAAAAAFPCPSCQRTPAFPAPMTDARDESGAQPLERRRVSDRRVYHPGAGRDQPVRDFAAAAFGASADPGLRRDGGVVVPAARVAPPEPPQGLAASPAPGQPPSTPPAAPSRWSGSAWLFARAAGGASLAGGGQLGGSQAGARIAYRVDDAGRLTLAARAYLPVDRLRGSEAALGIDWHPLPAIPFRLSVERRIAMRGDGRDAWSAYAAGGFFRGIGRSIELDGYGQAGIVGAHARDPFADGALRIAERVPLGRRGDLLLGAGAWGAAQPGAARLDVGPHVALRLPVVGATLAVAADWRLRVAGAARPGSGPALTLAADF